MQELCNLADTGSNTILYAVLASSLLIIASALLMYLKANQHYRYRGGSLSLLLVAGFSLMLLLAPTVAYAQSTDPNCVPGATQASQSGGNDNSNGQAAITCPENWVVVPGNQAYGTSDFCLMKYSAKNSGGTIASSNDINGDGSFLSNTYTGGTAISSPSGQPWANISQTDAITAAQTAQPGSHLITENEWMTIAHDILTQPANWCDADGSNCGVAPGTSGKVLASGHNDSVPNMPLEASSDDAQACFGTVTAGVNTPCGSDASTQKRTLTLSNGEVIWDLVGNVAHWTSGTETQGNLPSFGGAGGPFEYNTDTGFGFDVPDDWGTLSYTNPAIHNPAAASWGVANGVGILVSGFSSGSPTVIAFGRGGTWGVGPVSGAFTLNLGGTPSDSDPVIGFRATL